MPDTSQSVLLNTMNSVVDPAASRSLLPPVCEYLDRYSRGATMYPRQRTLMKIFFLDYEHFDDYDKMVVEQWLDSSRRGGEVQIPLDLYDRMKYLREHGYWHFKTIIYCGGRRAGKGFLGGKIAEYMCANMVALGNPQRFYGVDESKEMHLDVLATSYAQAQGMLYNDVKDAILGDSYLSPYVYSTSSGAQYIQTPADVRRWEELVMEHGKSMRSRVASIVVTPNAASSGTIRGRASFLQMFDELAHGDMAETYEAATPSLTQFDPDGMVYIPSSPWSKQGIFYDLYEQAMSTDAGHAVDPTTFAIRLSSWSAYTDWEYDPRKKRAIVLPPEKSPEMRARELRNPESFDVEFRANFAETENAYMNPVVVDQLFDPYPDEVHDVNVVSHVGKLATHYVCHADAGRSQDLFAFAIGHKELCDDGYWHVFIDDYRVWQPGDFPLDEDGVRRVDYLVPMKFFEEVCAKFYVDRFTMDQWNSAMFIDKLKHDAMAGKFLNPSMSVGIDKYGGVSNLTRWERFKTACYQKWVHVPRIEQEIYGLGRVCLPQEELKLLVSKSGKVDHQYSGAWCHNDLSDAISTVTHNLLADQMSSLEAGTLVKVVGAAQGGYNGSSAGRAKAQMRDMQQASADMMRNLGYRW